MKRVLLVVSETSQFPELKKILLAIKATGRYEPSVYFNLLEPHAGRPSDWEAVAYCLEQRLSVFSRFGAPLKSAIPQLATPPRSQPWDARLSDWASIKLGDIYEKHRYNPLIARTIQEIFSFLVFFMGSWRTLRSEKKFIHRFKPDLMVFAEDSLDYETPHIIKAARKRNIKSVVFPFTVANVGEFAEASIGMRDRHLDHSRLNRWTVRLFPHWAVQRNGHHILRNHRHVIWPNALLGLAPPQPWIMNSGEADVIVADSAFMADYFTEGGIPKGKIRTLGFISQDKLAEVERLKNEYRKQLVEELDLKPAYPIVLCALPPNQPRRKIVGFNGFDEWLDRYVTFLKTLPGTNVVFKTHPRGGAELADAMRNRFQIKVSERETLDLIPQCDVFVASISATIRWALACGKAVLNYDLYAYRYGDFERAPGLKTLETFEDFQESLTRIVSDPDYRREVTALQEKDKAYWGTLDGGATARILDLFDRLC